MIILLEISNWCDRQHSPVASCAEPQCLTNGTNGTSGNVLFVRKYVLYLAMAISNVFMDL